MAPIEAPHLRFLSDAANLLASQSSTTAAHLLSVHTQILLDERKALNTHQRKHHCGGCGNVRRSQFSQMTHVKAKPKNRGSSKQIHPSAVRGGALVYKCLRCNQRTVLPRHRSASRIHPKELSHTSGHSAPSTSADNKSSLAEPSEVALGSSSSAQSAPPKTLDNSNSKKRAKTRKQGGLQALLAAKKTNQPSLDLFDFLL